MNAFTWTPSRVADALGTPVPSARAFTAISTDTRTIVPGALFVPLVGERFDGHNFLEQAARGGATGAVVRRGTEPVSGLVLVEVDDTLAALGKLANARRRSIDGPVVAVTGTNGKTSTKELLAATLGSRWRTHATSGNLNNLVGLPLTILGAADDAEALVLEAGASEPGEVGRLRDIAEPTVAVVTNVAPGHVAGFGSLEAILTEKLSLLAGAPLAIVGLSPPALATRARTLAGRVVSAGLEAPADYRPDGWVANATGDVGLTFRDTAFRVPLLGRHQAANTMLALALAAELGLDLERVRRALVDVRIPGGRGEVLRRGDLTIINDTYNANPASLAAALEAADAMRRNRPLVIAVGSMLELGPESASFHDQMASAIIALNPHLVGAVGEFVAAFEGKAGLGDRLITASDSDALGRAIAPRLKGNELVLLKGSRGVRMERALPHLLNDREASCSSC